MNHIARQTSAFNSLNGEMNALWAEVNGGFGKHISLQIRTPTNTVCLVLKTDAIRAAKKAAIGKLDWESLPRVIYLVTIVGGWVDDIMWFDETLDAEEVYNIIFGKRGPWSAAVLSSLSKTQQSLLRYFLWLDSQLTGDYTSYRLPRLRRRDLTEHIAQLSLAEQAEIFKRGRKIESEDDLDMLFADEADYDYDQPDMSAAEVALHFEDRDESDGENEYGPEGAGFSITERDPGA
jgi:hypothetical protein